MTAKQAEYGYSECKTEVVIGSGQVYKCKNNDKPQIDSKLNHYEFVMLNDF